MPELTDEQMKDLLKKIKKNSIPLSLNISKEMRKKLNTNAIFFIPYCRLLHDRVL